MSVLRLDPLADISQEQGRAQLQETLDLVSNSLRKLQEEMNLVKESDKVVRPPSLREFPLASSGIITSTSGGSGLVGELVLSPSTSTPAGCLPCDNVSDYSAFTYPELFAIIGYNYPNSNSGNNTFRTPDLRGRVIIGQGTGGGGLTTRAQFGTGGTEDTTLSTAQLPSHDHSHSHTVDSHTHTGPSHTHDMTHTHTAGTFGVPGSGGLGPGINYTAGTTNAQYNIVIGGMSTTTTGAGGTGATGSASPGTDTDSTSAGSGNSHTNMQPWGAMSIYIRYASDSSGTSQSIPVNWGKVNGVFAIGTAAEVPGAAVSNTTELIKSTDQSTEGTITFTGASVAGSTSKSNRTLTGMVRVPYNFRKFREKALSIRTKVSVSGLSSSNSFDVTMKVNDPNQAGVYLSNTYTRNVVESSGTAADSEWVECILTRNDLAAAWLPGNVFRFELVFAIPQSYTSLTIKVGKLEINWR